MGSAARVAERMARAAEGQGYTRVDALQSVIAACDTFLERYAGSKTLNLAYIKAIKGAAASKLAAAPSAIVLPMRGQAAQRGKAQ